MAKRRSVEEHLFHLKTLRPHAHTPEARAEFITALADKSNLVVARGAEVIGEAGMRDAVSDLEKAFERLMNGEDKTCAGKTALAAALHALEANSSDVFLKGIRHIQKEGSWGTPVDVAATLRGICAMALVQIGYRHILIELGDLLADPEPRARLAAIAALASYGREEAAALLRMKARLGDVEPDVTAECLVALMKVQAPGKLEFVSRFLDSPEESIRTAAGLAVGEARSVEAFDLLRTRWDSSFDPARRMELLLPLAMLRLPEAVEFLLEVVETKPAPLASAAILAMKLYRGDATVRQRLTDIVNTRDLSELRSSLARFLS